MIVNRKKSETTKRKVILSPRSFDPFSNMIQKKNKSPILKPVCVKPIGKTLLNSYSVGKFTTGIKFLPPISPPNRSSFNIGMLLNERNSAKTPNFAIPGKCSSREFKNYSEMAHVDMSFGDVDEGSTNVNSVMAKYK